jgi:tetratricopeptide (TPR) repeat protein
MGALYSAATTFEANGLLPMRIDRQRSNLTFRPRRSRWKGCLPLLTLIGLCALVGWLGQAQIASWMRLWLEPSAANVTLADVESALAQGDLERASRYASQMREHDPMNLDAAVLLARILLYRSYTDYNTDHHRTEALALTESLIRRYPSELRVVGMHALTQQINDLSEDAARTSLRVIGRDAENMPARLALSLSYASRGLFDAALREAQRGVEIAQTSAPSWLPDAYWVLSLAYRDLGQYQEAAQAIEGGIAVNSRLLHLYFERASYALQVSDADRAAANYFSVLAFDENNVKARIRLCELTSNLAERETAIDWCNQVTELAPGWSEGWYRLGREYYLQGNYPQAQDAMSRCTTLEVAQGVPIEERTLECWFIQGQAAEVQGDCVNLLRLYDEFQAMAAAANLEQTWVYPPGGPPICTTPEPTLQG